MNTIANNHPLQPNQLTEDEFKHCRFFLKNFEAIYTLNYDLLLYWSLMHTTKDAETFEPIKCDDGFRHPDGSDSSDYVSWEMENSDQQNIHYLHGALHIFESDTELVKYTWSRTGVKLIDQISEALKEDRYPVIVAEGTSKQKVSRIMKSSYLQRSLKSLRNISGSLFVYGMALHENDEHVLKRIRKGKVNELWVGIYGDPKSKENVALRKRAIALSDERSIKKSLLVNFYDASTAKIWKS